jgi:iron complex transport system permease protein
VVCPAPPAAAFLGALGAMVLIVRLSTIRGRLNPYSLLLVGVIVNTIAAALILFVGSLSGPSQVLGILGWLSGSLAERRYGWIGVVVGVSALATLALWTRARGLNLLSLGEEGATQLGVEVARLRVFTFLASALLVGTAVSMSGIIGFVGLIVPHMLRLAVGSDLRLLIPASFLGGAIFLVWADAAARVLLAPTEIPVGVLTALCGGPFFIFLLRRAQERLS